MNKYQSDELIWIQIGRSKSKLKYCYRKGFDQYRQKSSNGYRKTQNVDF